MGQGNPAVQFVARNLTQARPCQRMGAEKQHVKLLADRRQDRRMKRSGGARARNAALPVGRFDIAFAPQINEYNGRRTVQLKVLDWREAKVSAELETTADE